jgi:aminoglycoside phosphotransferase family enzyme
VNDRSAMSELAPPNSSPQCSARTLDADCLRQLSQPGAYPHSTGAIELRETHISWILLTGKIAYKLKKPVNLGFLDFSSLGKRRHYCLEELRLNHAV